MEGGWPLTIGQARKIANHVIANRPVGGFRSKAEIQELVVFEPGATHPAGCKCGQNLDSLGADSRVTEDRWLYAAVPTGTGSGGVRPAIRDMVTVYSWIDEKVIRPWDLNGEGRRGLSLMPRAPINLNTATQPVLVALLADLRCESNYGTFYVGRSTARDIAKAMITQRKTAPFRSWPEFESWLDSANIGAIGEKSSEPARTNSDARGWWWPKSIKDFPEGLVPDPFYRSVSPTWSALTQKQGVKDLIKAQLNPNTMLNKFGQGANLAGRSTRAASRCPGWRTSPTWSTSRPRAASTRWGSTRSPRWG